jgi:hypothetical protein
MLNFNTNTMIRKYLSYILIGSVVLSNTSCEKGFDSINTSESGFTTLDPAIQLNGAINSASFSSSTLNYELAIVQQMVSPNGGVLAGANFNVDNRSPLQPLWQAYYRNVIRNTHDVILNTKNNPIRQNMYNMGRILQSFAIMVLTDTHGDVPYTEAGKGYENDNLFPKYDAQSVIYDSVIKILTEASAALTTTQTIETGDILYSGDITKWKRFGYSLLLRAGMRLSKRDPTRAATIAQAAFAAGVITTNADNAYMRNTSDFQQPIGGTLTSTEAANFYLAKPFVDSLKTRSDPRLSSIAVRYVGATSGTTQTTGNQNTTAAVQIGMPMGYDNGTIGPRATADLLASFYDYSQADRRRIVKNNSPTFFVTAAQTLLLLAEAKQKGWITTATTTDQFYNQGVTAHMEQMAQYDASMAIPAGSITTYLTANPFVPAQALRMIGTQYWIASFLNGPEAFANFRRTGFPALAPNPYPGKQITGDFIRRLTYPTSEISVNSVHVNEAIARQGPDNLETRVWWDN